MPYYSLGIDASKGYADFVIVDRRQLVVEPTFQLDDTFEGHHRLYKILVRFIEGHPDAKLLAAVESTGGYEANWLGALGRFQTSLPIRSARLNPALVRRHAEAEGCRVTTDATSAYYIATFQLAHPGKVHYQQDDSLATLRAQWTFIEQLTKQHTALLNQLESVLYRANPELLARLNGNTPAWALKLLKHYPTAERLARARPQTLAKIPYVSAERATSLVKQAKHSVAAASGRATEHLVEGLATQVLHLDGVIARQKKALARELDLPQEVELLKSFGSIGDYSAVGLLLQIEPIERFASAKEMASFFGIHPVFKQSGDGLGAMRMSKQGSPRIRALLFMITLNAIQRHPVIAPLFKRLVEKQGKKKMVAIGVCMHKTLRIIYGMLKHSREFDPQIERSHRIRYRPHKSASQTDRRRRYQPYDPAAPVSDRAKKKRRPRQDSQDAVRAENGMSTTTVASANKQRKPSKSSLEKQNMPA